MELLVTIYGAVLIAWIFGGRLYDTTVLFCNNKQKYTWSACWHRAGIGDKK